jgi:hypothetical protein
MRLEISMRILRIKTVDQVCFHCRKTLNIFETFANEPICGDCWKAGKTRIPRSLEKADAEKAASNAPYSFKTENAEQKETRPAANTSRELIEEIISWVGLPFRILWNMLLLIAAVSLTVAWIGFLFGSVLGVILMLIFLPSGFFLPMSLLALTVELFPTDH